MIVSFGRSCEANVAAVLVLAWCGRVVSNVLQTLENTIYLGSSTCGVLDLMIDIFAHLFGNVLRCLRPALPPPAIRPNPTE